MTSPLSTSREIFPSSQINNYEFPDVGASGPFSQLKADTNGNDGTYIHSVSRNQDYDCFAAGTSHGFDIYNGEPFRETFRCDLQSSGFKIVEMLFRCNILALVGAVANSNYPPNKVMIWDDHQSRCIGMDMKLLHQIETLANPRGLCCLSQNSNTFVSACPCLRKGQVHVEHFGLNMTKLINAHDSQIASFTLTTDGLLLATASVKGTLIRIFNIMELVYKKLEEM